MSLTFIHDQTPTDEVERREAVVSGLADAVRDLVDATIRTTVEDDEMRAVQAEVVALTERLRAEQLPGPAGVRYNSEGRSWSWGNAAVGKANAVAPPMLIHHDEHAPTSFCDLLLGAAYEGPPGMVHGGVSALLLDQIMGETASARNTRLAMTGTLTLRYRRPLPLGPVRLESRVAQDDGSKVTIEASIGTAEGPAVEASGLFIVPRWARG